MAGPVSFRTGHEGAAPPVGVKRLDGTRITEAVLIARLEARARKANVHGLGVSVFNAGEPLYSRAFGVKRTDPKEALSRDTVF